MEIIRSLLLFVSVCPMIASGQYDLTSCQDLSPAGSNVSAQTSPSPYRVTVGSSKYEDYVPVMVNVEVMDQKVNFRHFILQARCVNCEKPKSPIGSFTSIPPTTTLLKCSRVDGTVTSSEGQNKKKITVSWMPPIGFTGTVVMEASISKSSTYWWGVIKSDRVTPMFPKKDQTTRRHRRHTTTRKPYPWKTTTHPPSAATMNSLALPMWLLLATTCLANLAQ